MKKKNDVSKTQSVVAKEKENFRQKVNVVAVASVQDRCNYNVALLVFFEVVTFDIHEFVSYKQIRTWSNSLIDQPLNSKLVEITTSFFVSNTHLAR